LTGWRVPECSYFTKLHEGKREVHKEIRFTNKTLWTLFYLVNLCGIARERSKCRSNSFFILHPVQLGIEAIFCQEFIVFTNFLDFALFQNNDLVSFLDG